MTSFVPLSVFAAAVGLSRQAVEKVVARTRKHPTATWRGARPIFRAVHGRGGRSGLQYELRIDSLPLDLQLRFKDRFGEAPPQLSHGSKAQEERDFWYHVIAPALAHPKGSRERGQAVREAAAQERWRPGRKPFQVSERNIQRKLDDYEVHGLAGLGRAKRADAGGRAVILTREWDRAVNLPDGEKSRIASVIRDYVRGLHKTGTAPALIREYASAKLLKLTADAGCDLRAEGPAICRLPKMFIEGERVYRRVAQLRQHRKAYEDEKPRVLRTLASAPMAVLYGDVHPVDIVLQRPDGSTVHARMIGWLQGGWTLTEVHADAFRLAFSHKRQLTIRQGAVSIGGRRWTCPELVAWLPPKITALIPKYEDWTRIPLLDPSTGELVGMAEPQRPYGPTEAAGAIEAGRVSRERLAAVMKLARSAPDIDPLREQVEFLAMQPPSPAAPVGATVGASDDALRMLAAMNETPKEKRERETREREARVQQQLDAGAAVLAGLRRNRQR